MGLMRILILHGWGYGTDRWRPFVEALKKKGLTPELLGIPGLTAPIDRPWTLNDYVEWLKKEIADEKVILIGHSNGGRISLAFALKYPEQVDRLILIGSAGIRDKGLFHRTKRALFKGVAKLGRKMTSSERARRLLHKAARVNDYQEASPVMRETMTNLISVNLAPELHRINASALIVWGEKDRTTPLSQGRLMHELIPNSRLYVVEGACHSPQFTHSEEFCNKIVSWINDGF